MTSAAALLTTYPDRPAVVPHQRGRVYVSVHDAEYLRQKAEWKQRLAAVHPDTTGHSGFTFRKLLKERTRWEADERAWYAQFNLTPPDVLRPVAEPTPELLAYAKGRASSQRWRVERYLAEHPDANAETVAEALAIRIQTARVNLFRLRQPYTERGPERLLRLLMDGRSHGTDTCRLQLEMTLGTIHRAVMCLRKRGFDVITERRGLRQTYRLVSTPGGHS
jgi:hypothetical protein